MRNQPEIVAVGDLEVLVDVVQVPLERLALEVLPQVEPLLNAEKEGRNETRRRMSITRIGIG